MIDYIIFIKDLKYRADLDLFLGLSSNALQITLFNKVYIYSTGPESNSTSDYLLGSKYKLPEGYVSPFSERLDIPIQDECMLEAKSRISQLEDRKSDLEKKWDSQVSQVVSFFQELYSKLETRQTALLEQLSQMYHALMTPLQEAIQQLEQTVSYTGYVGVLSRYSQVAGIGDRIGDRIMDISMFVANYTLPTDPYMVNVHQKCNSSIQDSINQYLTVNRVINLTTPSPTRNLFVIKKRTSFKLCQETTRRLFVSPSDIAFNPTSNTLYALFDTYWKTYHQLPKSLKEVQTIKIQNSTSFPINSSMALLNNSVIIMANQILYVYSENGKILTQFQVRNQNATLSMNPKIYTFTGINSIYLAYIESPHLYTVNSQNGTNERVINLTTQVPRLHNDPIYDYDSTVCANFADMVRSTAQLHQLLILYTTYPTNNPPHYNTTNNQYYIQTYDTNSMQCTGVYSLSHQMSPFCCITALSDTLYILDICTGSVHSYLFSQMTSNSDNNINCNISKPVNRQRRQTNNCITLQRHSNSPDSIPKCTDIEDRTLQDVRFRAFCDINKKQSILLLSGKIHFLT